METAQLNSQQAEDQDEVFINQILTLSEEFYDLFHFLSQKCECHKRVLSISVIIEHLSTEKQDFFKELLHAKTKITRVKLRVTS